MLYYLHTRQLLLIWCHLKAAVPVHAVAHWGLWPPLPLRLGITATPFQLRHLVTLPMGWRGVKEEEETENVLSHLCSNPHTPSTHYPSKHVMRNAKNTPPSSCQTAGGHLWRFSVPPSPLLTQLLCSPTPQDTHLPTWQPCDLLQPQTAASVFTENFRSWSFTYLAEWKYHLKRKSTVIILNNWKELSQSCLMIFFFLICTSGRINSMNLRKLKHQTGKIITVYMAIISTSLPLVSMLLRL